MTLTEFLLARIEDEEQLAYDAASGGRPSRTGWQLWTSKIDTTPGGERLGPRGSVEASPARILSDCCAKRKLIQRLVDDSAAHYAPPEREWEWCPRARPEPLGDLPGGPNAVCQCTASLPDYQRAPALRYLALPYADHPDYDESWRP